MEANGHACGTNTRGWRLCAISAGIEEVVVSLMCDNQQIRNPKNEVRRKFEIRKTNFDWGHLSAVVG